jgi:pimeloyl-ACP methyl ester carboxylesterase
VARPGYDGLDAPADFAGRVDALAAALGSERPTVVVGVSGGATLALALGMREVPGLVGIVTHEPLIGPLEPVLHQRVADAGRSLAERPGQVEALDFCRALYGADTWRALPAEAHRWAEQHHARICSEVAVFASFAPTGDELASVRVPHLTTLGASSPPERVRVARLLEAAGAHGATIDGAGHLAHVEAPEAFAAAVGDFVATCGARNEETT